MSATQSSQLAPVPASIDNAEDWETIAGQITRVTGLPLAIGPDTLLAMVRTTVPLIYEAQSAENMNLLRQAFAAPVIAQRQRNADALLSGRPSSVSVHLTGGHVVAGVAVLRVHLCIQGERPDGNPCLDRQFWDLQLGAQVTVAQATCPTCGAPVAGGELLCAHCGSDLRTMLDVPMVVSHIDLY